MSRDFPTLRETLVTYQLHYETTAFMQLDAIPPVNVSHRNQQMNMQKPSSFIEDMKRNI